MSFLRRFLYKKKFWELQDLILPLVNNPIARTYLGVPPGKKIVKVTANSVHYQKNSRKITAIFYGNETIKEKGRTVVRTGTTIAMMLLALGIDKDLVLPLIGLTSVDYYPSASAEDGRVERENVAEESWVALRTGAGTAANYTEIEAYLWLLMCGSDVGTPWQKMARGIFMFDTSSLPDGATISAASLFFYHQAKADSWGNNYINIVSANPASTTQLVAADYTYTLFGTTKFTADKLITDIITNQYTEYVLNADGRAAISKTGISKFGVRSVADISNTPPTYYPNYYACLYFNFWQHATPTTRPKLTVTYGTTYYKTLPATEVAVLTLSRKLTWKKLLSVVEIGIASLLRIAIRYKTLAVTEASNVVLSLAKTFYRILSIAESSIVSLAKKTSKTLTTTEISIPSLGVASLVAQALEAIEISIATLSKIPGKVLTVIATTIPVISLLKTFYRTLSVIETSIVSLIKGMFKSLSMSAVSVVSLAKGFYRTLATTEISIPSLSKVASYFRSLSVVENSVVTLLKISSLFKTLAATEISVATMSWVRKITLSATAISIATISKLKTFFRTLAVTVIAIVRLKVPTHYWNKFTKQATSYINKYSKRGDSYHDKY